MNPIASVLLDAPPSLPDPNFPRWRADAERALGRPVIDACLFSRRGSAVDSTLSNESYIAEFLLRAWRKRRAGGLPPRFLVAVTATDVIIEGRSWPRTQVRASYEVCDERLDVILDLGGRRVECTMSDRRLFVDFLALLNDPARRHPAGT